MNKKFLSLIAAQVLATPAFGQGSNVVIYGTFNVDFENVERDGATAAGSAGNSLVASPTAANALNQGPRNRVSNNSSNIGFRGTEELGGGLKAIFQLESSVSIDTGGGNLASRNSNAGLTGAWGTVFYGLWDTPYKFITLRQDAFFGTGIGAGKTVIGSPGFGVIRTTQSGRVGVTGVPAVAGGAPIPGVFSTVAVSGAPDAAFDRRQGNSVQYWTPVWSGLSARLAYSANEQKSANEATPNINPYIGSAAVFYENGPLYAALAYDRHEDYFGLFGLTNNGLQGPSATNPGSRDSGYKAGIGYTFFGSTTLNVIAERLEYENDQSLAGAVTEYSRNAIYVSLLHKIGPGTIRASFSKASSGNCAINAGACSTAGLGVRHAVLGYSHTFSKRTAVYALYSYVDNDRLASYNFGFNPVEPAGVGSDPSGLAVGIRHTF
ncbi:MAG: porin [Burkholderiales bacterium]|nr:porin [Burkholderiales bacterium]